MFRWCAYCQTYMGQKEPYHSYVLTHGICQNCKATNAVEEVDLDKIKPLIDFFEEFKSYISEGPPEDIDPVIARAKALKIKPSDLLAGIIQPLLYEIGRKYEANELRVYQEHAFSDFTHHLINRLMDEYQLLKGSRKSPDVLLVLPEGEYHIFGIKFLEVLLRQEGINAKAVYPSLPVKEVYELTCELKPKVLCYSVVFQEHFEQLLSTLDVFKNCSDEVRPLIVVGGQGCTQQAPSQEYVKVHTESLTSFVDMVKDKLKAA